MTCKYHDQCVNNALCHLCIPAERLLKFPKPPPWERKSKGPKKRRMGSKLEKKTLKEYKKAIPDDQKARLTINSGALWFDTGDIDTEMLLLDSKDHAKINAKGEHSISIKKEWLEKLANESGTDKFPCLPFQFKNDNTLYAVMKFDDILALVQVIMEGRKKDVP